MIHLLLRALLAISGASAVASLAEVCPLPAQCQSFVIELTWGPTDPSNALSRNAILTNGSFPGPPLKTKVGDCVNFTVINNLPNETGVHFHGIRQLATPWADGVPGVSQSAIPSGATYHYQWTADASGVYFYHAHYKGQIMDGLYGPIVIAPSHNATKPFASISHTDVAQLDAAEAALQTVMISDWNQYTFDEFLAIEQTANIDFACTDSILLNGYGSTYCLSEDVLATQAAIQVPQILNGTTLTAKGCIPASNPAIQGGYVQNPAKLPAGAYDECTSHSGRNATFTVDPADEWAALAFINPGGTALLKVTVDGHQLYVYEVNGNYIVPQTVDQIEVANGDRISVFVKLDQIPADYQIRVANSGINQVISGFGVLSYQSSFDTSSRGVALMNYGGQNLSSISVLDKSVAAPWTGTAPPVAANANASHVLDIRKTPASDAAWSWVLNGQDPYNQSRDDITVPLLYQDPSTVPESDLLIKTRYNQWVDLIIRTRGPLAEPHPIHKHANKFYVIGSGRGDFNYSTVAAAQAAGMTFNLVDPPYVDGYTTLPNEGSGAWAVLRYQANTPGAWLLHCHVQSHFSGGMAVAILDAVDRFSTLPWNSNSSSSSSNACATSGDSVGSSGRPSNTTDASPPAPAIFTGTASNTSAKFMNAFLALMVVYLIRFLDFRSS